MARWCVANCQHRARLGACFDIQRYKSWRVRRILPLGKDLEIRSIVRLSIKTIRAAGMIKSFLLIAVQVVYAELLGRTVEVS